MDEFNLDSAKASLVRLKIFRNECTALMEKVRGIVDDEVYEVLSRAYSATGNASREMRILIEKIEELTAKKD